MKRISGKRQSGYALILMVLALMGVGGIVLAGFTQESKLQTEQQRYLHNERVLKEAKQALLQYAYNYPQMGNSAVAKGPGRLPCPDTDNNGIGEGTAYCGSPNGLVGRLPWNDPDMQFYDARDASGSRLWYAVSSNFANNPALVINSATTGSITIADLSGALLHDATSTPSTGVAAVIIAPGAAIDRNGTRQDRRVSNSDNRFDTTADTDPGIVDPVNYLDIFGAVDNADFTNDDANGFITGPIRDVTSGDLLVNDQMIVITAAEVIAAAEKAVLQAYRDSIRAYLAKTGGVYPWLYNYDGVEYNVSGGEPVDVAIAKLSSYFPVGSCSQPWSYPPSWHNQADCVANGGVWNASFADELENYLGRDTSGPDNGIFGRIPSIFADYFTETDSLKIESKLAGSLVIDFSSLVVSSTSDGLQTFADGVVTIPFSTTVPLTDVGFDDIADSVGNDGRFTATMPSPQTFSRTVYFWDDDDSPTDVWRICGNDADDVSDCWRDSAGNSPNPTPHGSNDNKEYILEVVIQFKLEGTLNIDVDHAGSPPTISLISPANAGDHAIIESTYNVGDLLASSNLLPMITATYIFDHHYHADGGSPEVFQADPVGSFGNLTTANLAAGTSLTLGIRYFPELPAWTFDNDWHNSIRMAYALEYKPPGTGPCIVNSTCLHLNDSPGTPQNVAALLVIAGTHDWKDLDVNGRLKNDVDTVFDDGNHDDNPRFYRHIGNDKLLVIEEL